MDRPDHLSTDATVPAVQLGVQEFVAVVREFSARLEANRAALDALNVFPVADNDTGSNMWRTLTSITATFDAPGSFADVARRVENAALDGRGNSGLIVGQFLAGFASLADGDTVHVGPALLEGAQWARRAVAEPVEGTMLTVADVAAASAEGSVDELLEAVAAAVEKTPSQLAVLAERGVVDSGAAGLLLFFQALAVVMSPDAHPEPDLIVCNVGFQAAEPPPASAYEIQFRVPSSLISDEELKALLVGIGTDVVVGSSADQLAAHLHVADPHRATASISEALEHRPGAKAISYDVEPILASGPRS